MAHHWLKFWPQDWQRDPALRSCSAASRGVWIDMLCIMHEGQPYGHLTIGGKPATVRQIGTLTGVGEKEATKLLRELDDAGVFSRTADGTIFSRRMVRDHERSEEGRTNVAKRWSNGTGSGPPDTPPNRGAKSGGNTLEARSKKLEARSERGSNAGALALATTPPPRQEKIPEDWLPDIEMIAYAKERGITDIVESVEQFINYNTAHGKIMADWNSTWRLWCNREPEFRRNGK